GLVAGWLLNEGPNYGTNPPPRVWRSSPSPWTDVAAADYSGNEHTLQRSTPNDAASAWVPTNGKSLLRVQTALHLTLLSQDSALQK
ncbi:MAG: hypothetical protein ABIZ49_12795, partial [Opitutaceae bacterium]